MKFQKTTASLLLALTLVGCTSSPFLTDEGNINKKSSGTAGGAAVGALLGQLIGKDTKGTLIGAGMGALAGLGWGAYRDQQEAALRASLKNTAVQVQRDGENISLYLPGGVTFASDSAQISGNFYSALNSIAQVLVQYPETQILVQGHTDSTGSFQHNMDLSNRRANSVKHYLIGQGVASNRLMSQGFGPNNPVADNSTPDGRQMNRRVEIIIAPKYN